DAAVRQRRHGRRVPLRSLGRGGKPGTAAQAPAAVPRPARSATLRQVPPRRSTGREHTRPGHRPSHTVIFCARNRSVMPSATKAAQVRLHRVTPSHCRVVLDNPPLNLMGPEFVPQIREIVTALENDGRVKVVVFESAVDGFFLNHSDFLAKFEDLTSIPQGPTGLEAWPDVLVRLTR